MISTGLRAVVAALLVWTALVPAAAAQPPGRQVYEHHCAVCHGESGNGNGPAAGKLRRRPADLTAGRYQFRSTPSGAVPTDEDLAR